MHANTRRLLATSERAVPAAATRAPTGHGVRKYPPPLSHLACTKTPYFLTISHYFLWKTVLDFTSTWSISDRTVSSPYKKNREFLRVCYFCDGK